MNAQTTPPLRFVPPLEETLSTGSQPTAEVSTSLASSPRRRGAQPGNRNALKHGFYSAHFYKSDLTALEAREFVGLADEITLLRLYIRHVVELGAGVDQLHESLDLLRALCLAASSLTRLVKTHALLANGHDEVSLAIQKVYAELVKAGELIDDSHPVFPPRHG